jgi:hypothetical protein
MATLTLAGVTYTVPAYKLGALRQAAPFLDSIKDSAGDESAATSTSLMADIVGVFAVGLQKIDPKLTAEYICDELVGPNDFPELQRAFYQLLGESGMTEEKTVDATGEAAPPSPDQPVAGASASL